MPSYDENLVFCYDIDKIPALSERRKKIDEISLMVEKRHKEVMAVAED